MVSKYVKGQPWRLTWNLVDSYKEFQQMANK